MSQSPIEERVNMLEMYEKLDLSLNTVSKITQVFRNTKEEKREALAAKFRKIMETMTEQALAAEADRMLEMIEVTKHESQ